MPSVYDVYFGWRKVVNVAITILTGAESGTTSSDCSGMNSVIASFANRQQQPTTEKEDSVPLKGRDKADLRDIALGDYVFCLYCHPGLGCIHNHIKWYLVHGHLDHHPEMFLPCNDKCFVCSGSYKKILPVIHKEAIRFLKSSSRTI